MNVSELIVILSEIEPDREVIIASDAEGNSFETLHTYGLGNYDGECVGPDMIDEELAEAGFTEEDIVEGQPVVVLWP